MVDGLRDILKPAISSEAGSPGPMQAAGLLLKWQTSAGGLLVATLCGHLAQDSSTFLFRSPRRRIDFKEAAWLKRVREAKRPPEQPLGTLSPRKPCPGQLGPLTSWVNRVSERLLSAQGPEAPYAILSLTPLRLWLPQFITPGFRGAEC